MQMVPMTITKEYWALILTMFCLDSANRRIESVPTNVSFEQLLFNKVKSIQEKQKNNQMKLDLQAKIENPNILLYVQPHPHGILPF